MKLINTPKNLLIESWFISLKLLAHVCTAELSSLLVTKLVCSTHSLCFVLNTGELISVFFRTLLQVYNTTMLTVKMLRQQCPEVTIWIRMGQQLNLHYISLVKYKPLLRGWVWTLFGGKWRSLKYFDQAGGMIELFFSPEVWRVNWTPKRAMNPVGSCPWCLFFAHLLAREQ